MSATGWTAENEEELQKYYELYQSLDDVLYLIQSMLSGPKRTCQEIAKKLYLMKIVDQDFLFSHFPELEKENYEAYGKDVDLFSLRCHSLLLQLPDKATASFRFTFSFPI